MSDADKQNNWNVIKLDSHTVKMPCAHPNYSIPTKSCIKVKWQKVGIPQCLYGSLRIHLKKAVFCEFLGLLIC